MTYEEAKLLGYYTLKEIMEALELNQFEAKRLCQSLTSEGTASEILIEHKGMPLWMWNIYGLVGKHIANYFKKVNAANNV